MISFFVLASIIIRTLLIPRLCYATHTYSDVDPDIKVKCKLLITIIDLSDSYKW